MILHPFSGGANANSVLRDSAQLSLEDRTPDQERVYLGARYCELRMLCFIGKDATRWLEQCMDFVARQPELAGLDIREQSFAAMLTSQPPPEVAAKFRQWGVADYAAIFSRALGLATVFAHPPELRQVTEEFLRGYHHYADYLFACRQQMTPFEKIGPPQFRFELYASGEYTRILERQFETER